MRHPGNVPIQALPSRRAVGTRHAYPLCQTKPAYCHCEDLPLILSPSKDHPELVEGRGNLVEVEHTSANHHCYVVRQAHHERRRSSQLQVGVGALRNDSRPVWFDKVGTREVGTPAVYAVYNGAARWHEPNTAGLAMSLEPPALCNSHHSCPLTTRCNYG